MAEAIKRRNLVRIMEKLMTKHMAATDPFVPDPKLKVGALYRFKDERNTWTDSDGWLWSFTGEYESDSGLQRHMPIFKAVATGHTEWLPLDWLEEVSDD